MIKLIKNELYKIFHKKILYIVLFGTIALTILFGTIDKIISKDKYESIINEAAYKISIYEADKVTSSPEYIDYKTQYDVYTLLKDKKIKEDSPEEFYVLNTVYSNMYDYYTALYGENKDNLKTLKNKMDESINFLNNFDWKKVLKDEIKSTEEEICNDDKRCESIKETTLKVLDYRLKNSIPLSSNNASNKLNEYIINYTSYYDIKDSKDELLDQSSKAQKQELQGKVEIAEYEMNNKLIQNDYKGDYSASEMVLMFSHVSFVTAMVLLILSSTTVAEEYNKGTIKQLLVKPYSRTKIIIGKMLAILIAEIIFIFVYNIIYVIFIGLYEGDISTLLSSHIIYNYRTNTPFEISYVLESLIAFVYSLPSIILLGLFTFTLATITTNTAFSLGMGFCAYISESLFEAYMRRFQILSYAPTVNYNFDAYMWGKLSYSKDIFLSKSIIISVISFVVLFTISIIVFKKKDIKNQ